MFTASISGCMIFQDNKIIGINVENVLLSHTRKLIVFVFVFFSFFYASLGNRNKSYKHGTRVTCKLCIKQNEKAERRLKSVAELLPRVQSLLSTLFKYI